VVNSISASLLSALYTQTSSGETSFGIGVDTLTSWARAKAGIGLDLSEIGKDPDAPLATVWQPGIAPSAEALAQRALAGKAFFDINAKLYSDLGATGDYRKLFALHTGIGTLESLATALQDEEISSTQRASLERQFKRGLEELQTFFGEQKFSDVRLAQGDRYDEAKTTLQIPKTSEDYVTQAIHRGTIYSTIAGLPSDAQFEIKATSFGGTVRNVAIDLSDLGSLPRTLSNVVNLMNSKLSAAGAASRIEIADLTPKTSITVVAGKVIETPFKGTKSYGIKVDVRSNETVSFTAVDPAPALYMAGAANGASQLIKLADVGDAAGQPVWLSRPDTTADPIGANVATGWYGPGGTYTGAAANALETRTSALIAGLENPYEDLLEEAGEATLKLTLADGRDITVTTAWRKGDQEAWRALAGESEDQAILNDLSERLTQLLHEQGVAAGVDVWEDGVEAGLSIFTGDLVKASSLTISGRAALLTPGDDPAGGLEGGLRTGAAARSFTLENVRANNLEFIKDQTFNFQTARGTETITVSGGYGGITGAQLQDKINDALRDKRIAATATIIDDGANYDIRFDTLHETTGVTANLNGTSATGVRGVPPASTNGGLPANAGAVRTYDVAGGSPLLTETGALEIDLVVETPTGNKTVSVDISAADRLAYPDVAPGELHPTLKARIDEALNAAGLYVGANDDLSQWQASESASQRIASLTINGQAQTLETQTPGAIGGAFSVTRSFTSAEAATGVADEVADLVSDPTASITFTTVWGEKTVSTTLDPGDPRTLESAALRLNEELARQGYDLGVEATALSGGGAGLRVVAGETGTIGQVGAIELGAASVTATLDPIDSQSHADDPVGALSVAERAARGGGVVETRPSLNTLTSSGANVSGWTPGRAFDITLGGAAKVATARAVQAGPNGSVYVLADLAGDSSTFAVKGVRDVALLKYDSAGNLVHSNFLGASDEASGYALAVSADGKVAVAGSVTGVLAGAGAEKGGTDSFVAMYGADGKEMWRTRRAATANDQINAIAFTPQGGLVVAGKTESALGPALALGGSDAYLRGFSATGLETFTRQFGGAGEDAATALLVRDNGVGGVDIVTGGVESSRGVLRSFTYSTTGGLVAVATRDIGYFPKGAINALAADGASLYVGGEVGADRLSIGGVARSAVAGQEGFVARIATNLTSTALDRTTYLGSSKDDSVTGMTIVGGQVYAVGSAGSTIAGQGANAPSAFLTRLDDDGEIDWTRSFTSLGRTFTPTAITGDAGGASALDILGLPRGQVDTFDSRALVDRSGVRAGEQFSIGLLGGRATTITIGKDETLNTLAAKINRALGGAGRAEIVKEDKGDRLRIVSAEGKSVALGAGAQGKDALAALGLEPGVIAINNGKKGDIRTFGLGLNINDLKFDTAKALAKSKAELSAAKSIISQAYEAIANPNKKALTAEEQALENRRKASGAPEYYSKQLANYQAALFRLTGETS